MFQWTKIYALIRMSLRSLMLHKLRSLLTVLGLVIGVASVIIMLSIAEGAGRENQRQIESLGINNIIVRSVKPSEDDSQSERQSLLEYGLTYDDMRRIKDTMADVEDVAPFREFRHEARYLDRMIEARVVGIRSEYKTTNRLQVVQGRFIEPYDLQTSANVCVLGAELAAKLFRYESPLEQTVQIADKHRFQVVGVTATKMSSAGAGSSLAAQDFNRDFYIPLTTDQKRIGEVLYRRTEGGSTNEKLELSQLTVRVKGPDRIKSVAAAIESLLSLTHEKDDFAITIPLDLLERLKASQQLFTFILASIAAISLLVGGIGIMNIMLATVSERTGEIGIRRALGATKSDITLQFLVETLVLSATGALIGAAVGVIVPPIISLVSGRETAITFWGPCIAVVVALVTGLIFGIYPARRAASLDPIEALRRV